MYECTNIQDHSQYPKIIFQSINFLNGSYETLHCVPSERGCNIVLDQNESTVSVCLWQQKKCFRTFVIVNISAKNWDFVKEGCLTEMHDVKQNIFVIYLYQICHRASQTLCNVGSSSFNYGLTY